jgi:hypothetical protein
MKINTGMLRMTNNSDTTALSRIAPWHSANHRADPFATIVARAARTAMPMVLKTRSCKDLPAKTNVAILYFGAGQWCPDLKDQLGRIRINRSDGIDVRVFAIRWLT